DDSQLAEVLTSILFIHEDLVHRKEKQDLYHQDLLDSIKEREANFNNTYDGIIIHDCHGVILNCNQRALDILLYSKEELLSMSTPELQSPRKERIPNPDYKIEFKGDTHSFEQNYYRKDDSFFPSLISTTKYKYKDRNLFQKNIRDITEERKLQEQLVMSTKFASIGELAAGVGHEINNPLIILKGNLSMLETYFNDQEDRPKKINTVFVKQKRAIDRIADIVTGLRTYARKSDQIETLNLNDVIMDTLFLIENIYLNQGIIIEMISEVEDPYFDGASGKFQQVLMNLLTNAKDALENVKDKKITIKIQTGDDFHFLRVSDNGAGMPKEVMAKIFDNLFTTKPKGQGTGLGMGITKSIIEDAGGTIQAESTEEKGTTFTVALPKSSFKEKIEVLEDNSSQKSLEGNVLVVDDEEDIRDCLVMYIENMGLEVDQACSGHEALVKMSKKNYAYVITDYTMPGMNGDELIAKMKQKNYSSKVLLVTGGTNKISSDQNPFSVLYKPFDTQDLLNALRKL
ncbi:MAG: response regulator, partial [Halobacteriovoraceae bacterium]|nr:response regulator [Halobacteriovoraceae bacterium]